MKRGGTVMPDDLRQKIENDPEYTRCAFGGYEHLVGSCEGRVTREHAVIQAGKKLQRRWAIVPCCAKHHGVDFHQDGHQEAPKRMRVWVALNRASDEDLLEFPKSSYLRERELMNRQYGVYAPPPVPQISNALKADMERASRPPLKVSKPDFFEREVRAYARTNGCTSEEARETLLQLA